MLCHRDQTYLQRILGADLTNIMQQARLFKHL
jgi:hypothetical protein